MRDDDQLTRPSARGDAQGRLSRKDAVIAGGTSGVVLATAHRFVAEGACVVVADHNEADGCEFLSSLSNSGRRANTRFIRTDVAHEDGVEARIAQAVEEFGRVDIVLNNASGENFVVRQGPPKP